MGGRGASSGAKGGAGSGKFEAYRAEQQEETPFLASHKSTIIAE